LSCESAGTSCHCFDLVLRTLNWKHSTVSIGTCHNSDVVCKILYCYIMIWNARLWLVKTCQRYTPNVILMFLVHFFFKKLHLKYKKSLKQKCKIVTLLRCFSSLTYLFFGCWFVTCHSGNDIKLIFVHFWTF